MTQLDPRTLLDDDGAVHIDKPTWETLNASYSRPELTTALHSAIELAELPLKAISLEAALADFGKLRSTDPMAYIRRSSWAGKYQITMRQLPLCISAPGTGLLASDYFAQRVRYTAAGRGYPSPVATWETPRFRQGLIDSFWSLNLPEITGQTIRTAIRNRKYIAAQFRPAAAAALLTLFGATDVLDFSAGWGDRLTAALAVDTVRSYTGIDPNRAMIPVYRQMVAAYRRADVRASVLCQPAEDVGSLPGSYDTVLTSPPYFDKERYTQDDTQSWVRYRTLDAWLSGFLFPALRLAWQHLLPGGIMAVNVSNFRAGQYLPGTQVRVVGNICDPMCRFVASLPEATTLGACGLRMGGRTGKNSTGGAPLMEPIFVWGRGPRADLLPRVTAIKQRLAAAWDR